MNNTNLVLIILAIIVTFLILGTCTNQKKEGYGDKKWETCVNVCRYYSNKKGIPSSPGMNCGFFCSTLEKGGWF